MNRHRTIASFLTLLLATVAALGAIRPASAQPPPTQPDSETYAEDEFETVGEIVDFPEPDEPLRLKLLEAVPTALSWPDRPLGEFFAGVLGTEHVETETELSEIPMGIQSIPDRPRLIIEWNERFLSPGFLPQGLELPTGTVWRPAFWVFGTYRGAYQYFDTNRAVDPVSEIANSLELFGQVNLSGTERILVGMRPLDQETLTSREFTGWNLRNGDYIDGGNAQIQTLFFEGDFGEIFPFLDPYDSYFLDYGFSVGRMPLFIQQGLLINEDKLDAVTVSRNTLNGSGVLNMLITGVYSWNNITRSSSVGRPNTIDDGSQMVGIFTETDVFRSTINLDGVYVYGDPQFGDMCAFGASAIQRFYGAHNTYNTSLHVLASFPTNGVTPFADQGELLFAQTSWTPHHTEDLIYVNAFWAIDQFTGPARGQLFGGPLGQTGILFAAPALGRAGTPINNATNNVAGASLGYQFQFDETRQQLIWEVGGRKETNGPVNQGVIVTGMRYQKAFGRHFIGIVDGFVGKPEGMNVTTGARAELLIKF